MSLSLQDLRAKMVKSLEAFQGELARQRTGRASISLLDGIRVDSYGSQMLLSQVATLGVPESRMITISPWDKSLIGEIEKSILKSGLGLQPMNDGKLVRIPIPVLTEERRKDLVKHIKKQAEEAKIHMRNIRREGNEIFKSQQKDKQISEDDYHKSLAELQKITDEFIAKIDQAVLHKEKEIMEV